MATKKVYDLAVKVGEYTDRDGNTKARWLNVGRVLQKDDGGKFIMLDRTFNPAGVPDPEGRDTVLLSMFEPRQDDGGGQRAQGSGGGTRQPAQRQAASRPPMDTTPDDDDIPF